MDPFLWLAVLAVFLCEFISFVSMLAFNPVYGVFFAFSVVIYMGVRAAMMLSGDGGSRKMMENGPLGEQSGKIEVEEIKEISDKNVEQQQVDEEQIKIAEEAEQVQLEQVYFKIVKQVEPVRVKQ
ncbi:hypothetical protein GGF32_006485 [Allomyces javanicus]|nr:hypothetical protein GGF32_006485 [Allomyces javanicus]